MYYYRKKSEKPTEILSFIFSVSSVTYPSNIFNIIAIIKRSLENSYKYTERQVFRHVLSSDLLGDQKVEKQKEKYLPCISQYFSPLWTR